MDRRVEVRTPESVGFEYQLAGLGSRFVAVAVDVVIQYLLLFGILWGVIAVGPRVGRALPPLSHLAVNIAIAMLVFVVFIIFFGYFIVFEAFWRGQTPGKRLLGIRVVRDGGYPMELSASLVRNVIRVAEALLGFYAIAAVSALISAENKRVGDFAAGTIVVRDAPIASPAILVRDLAREPVYAPTSVLEGEERALVHRFIERRDALPPGRRAALAAQLAARVRPRVSTELAALDDEGLLERL